jgi:hypothetical protein
MRTALRNNKLLAHHWLWVFHRTYHSIKKLTEISYFVVAQKPVK